MTPSKSPFFYLKKIVFSTFIFILLTSCSTLSELASVQKPSLNVENIRVSDLNLSEVELTFDLKIDNPNPVNVSLNSYEYDLKIDDNSFVKGSQPLESNVMASSASEISVPVAFTFQELFETFSEIRDKDQSAFTFNASFDVEVPVLGVINIPVEKSGTFPIVKAPKISFESFSVKSLSLTKAELELNMEVENPNIFGVQLSGVNYDIDLDNISSLTGEISQEINLDSGGTQSIQVPATVNIAQLGLSVYRALRNKDPLSYGLSGSANVGADLPIFDVSTFNFDKSGTVNILD